MKTVYTMYYNEFQKGNITMRTTYPFPVMPLPYSYDALEPQLSGETLTFHHDKHYQTYVDNLNKILADYPDLQSMTLEELLININDLPNEIKTPIRNNAGGVFNHQLYFACMQGNGFHLPEAALLEVIRHDFGSFDSFQSQLTQAAMTQFGSGYGWLIYNNGSLEIMNTANQDTPISKNQKPLLNIDVWEHAYYLQYQNRRADYVSNWFSLINWDYVNSLYQEALTASFAS